MGTETYWDIKR